MKRREYTKEFKQEAVALSNEQGINVAQVARELGIESSITVPVACRDAYRWCRSVSWQRQT